MRRFIFALVASCLLAPAHSQTTPTIKVDARLVTVPVTVRDKKGNLVNNLKQKDFEIASDGHTQTIRYFDRDNDLPLTLGLLVDVSMSQRDVLDDEREASSAFLADMLAPDRDQAFVIQFGASVDLLADVTKSLPKLQAGLKKIDAQARKPNFRQRDDDGSSSDQRDSDQNNSGSSDSRPRHRGQSSGGGTAMYDAIFLASDEVISKQKNRKALVLLTDGVDMGSRTSIAGSIEAAQRADTAVYAIYYKGQENGGNGPMRNIMNNGGPFGGGGRHGGGGPGGGGRGGQGGGQGNGQRADGKKILERICGETGGHFFEVSKKETVASIYKQIAEELRNQYRIGFTPSNTEDGYHTLNVTVPADTKLHLQAREGYYSDSK